MLEVKLFEPTQAKYVPEPLDVKLIGEPRHTGLFELAVAVGKAFTVTSAVAKAVHPLVFSTITV